MNANTPPATIPPKPSPVRLTDALAPGREDFWRRLLDSTPDGVMVIDRARRIRFINRAGAEMLGRDAGAIVASNCMCHDAVNCHLTSGESLAGELCPARGVFDGTEAASTSQMLMTTAGGEARWIETSYSTVRDERGEVAHVVGVLRDVHDRKRLEARVQESEHRAMLGDLTASIAHEIKNPLGILLSACEIVLDESRPRAMHREAAQFLKEEVKRLDERMRTFLNFARPVALQTEPVVFNSFVRRMAERLLMPSSRVGMSFDFAPPDYIVAVDPDQMQLVLTNLVVNAYEAIYGEAVDIAQCGGELLLRTLVEDGKLVLEVHDSGPGIDDQVRPRLFTPFFTTKARGSGLGLALVAKIIAAHGGTITAQRSARLGGACLRVVLPLANALERDEA